MFDRLVTRQIGALVVALGIFLSGAPPAWADATMSGKASRSSGMPMMMPGMDMQNSCMPDKYSSGKQAPYKSTDSCCAVCAGCAVNAGLTPSFSLVALVYHRNAGLFVADAQPDGLTTAPAIPPPSFAFEWTHVSLTASVFV
jgi:hypothetical protein